MIVSWCGIVTEGRPPSIHAEREGDTHYGETSEAPWSTLHKSVSVLHSESLAKESNQLSCFSH